MAVNGPAVSGFLRAVTGIPDLVWSGSRPLAGHPDTEELFFSDLDYNILNPASAFSTAAGTSPSSSTT